MEAFGSKIENLGPKFCFIKKKDQLCMNKLRTTTFNHLIIVGGSVVFSHY